MKTRLQPFWKRTREWLWARQALQVKEQRPWGHESQRQKPGSQEKKIKSLLQERVYLVATS